MAATPIKIHLDGTAGQSFGVWNAGGVELYLTGDANDYVGKGMAGGKLVIKPHLALLFTAMKPLSLVTPACMVQQEVNCLQQVLLENALVYVTRVLSLLSKARGTMPVSI
ncbi:glutamate synthase [NADPH] large chain [Vibrio astriarenae]|nr:glutamate synthase [NADPH] large chain [Vibrio sp. C7]